MKVTPEPGSYPPFSQLSQALIRSGLWASLGNDARALFPVILTLAHVTTHVTIEPVKHSTLQELSGLSCSGVKRGLKELREARLIDSYGPTSARYYVITDLAGVQKPKCGPSKAQMWAGDSPNMGHRQPKYGLLETTHPPAKAGLGGDSGYGTDVALNIEYRDIERAGCPVKTPPGGRASVVMPCLSG